jgi:TRAP-type C4-dicarboxylate transport system permease small subunit
MGIEEMLLFPAVWLYFLGGSAASKERSHIDCGVLVLYIKKEKSLALFKLVRIGVSFLIGLWAMYYAWWFFMYSLTKWKLSDLLYIPMFLGESAVFIGLLLMIFFTFVELLDRVADYREILARKG